MLAVRAPGQDVDVAPSWLVEEATKHSKVEYERTQRTRGRARGRGSEGKGDSGKQQDSKQQDGGDWSKGRGRVRGR